MVDHRFYDVLGPAPLAELAAVAGAELDADADAAGAARIADVAPIDRAGASDLSYIDDARALGAEAVAAVAAGACFAKPADKAVLEGLNAAILWSDRPQAAFARAARAFVRPRGWAGQQALISPTAVIAEDAIVAPGVVIGDGADIGPGACVEPNAVIGPGVTLGARARVGAGAAVSFAIVGDDTAIHAGAVIGDTGFGVTVDAQGLLDAPHFGRVVIGERVTIGANTTVDRGRFDDTVIMDDAKLDNLVQIAHNVRVGRAAVIAGCCGVAGSSTIGHGAVLGGSVGVKDHLSIGDGAQVAAATVLMHNVPAGEIWAGMPGKPIKTFFREVALLSKLARDKRARTKAHHE